MECLHSVRMKSVNDIVCIIYLVNITVWISWCIIIKMPHILWIGLECWCKVILLLNISDFYSIEASDLLVRTMTSFVLIMKVFQEYNGTSSYEHPVLWVIWDLSLSLKSIFILWLASKKSQVISQLQVHLCHPSSRQSVAACYYRSDPGVDHC